MADVKYRSMMNSSDAIIWHIERDPKMRSTIMGVWELDSVPTPERMRESLDRMVAAIPRLHQRVESGRPRPRWIDVHNIDLDQHYSTHVFGGHATPDDALVFAQDWVREPFDRTRPLWRLGLLTGFADGKAAIVIKVHHAIADGIGMVLMLAAFTDLEPNPIERFELDQPTHESRRSKWSSYRRGLYRLGRAAKVVIRQPSATITSARRTLISAARVVMPNRTPLSSLMTKRSGELCLHSRAIPIAAVKAAGRASGVSLNDVFVGIVTDAVGRYHDVCGAPCERLRIHMPVNIRNERTATLAGNQFVPARLALRVPRRGALGGLASVRDQLEHLRAEPGLPHINTISAAIQRLGVPAARWIIGGMMKGVDVLASNVPGPNFPLYLAGARVNDFVAFGPPAGAALNITLFSYQSTVYLGVTTDSGAIADRHAFLACLDNAIEATVGSAPIQEHTVASA